MAESTQGQVSVGAAVEHAFREEWARVLAAVARSSGDLDLAEECTQEAYATALRTWTRDGVPDRPGAWLTTTARRHAIDRLRRRRTESEKTETSARLAERVEGPLSGDPAAAVEVLDDPFTTMSGETAPGAAGTAEDGTATTPDDDLLRLIFTCCHPALPLEGRVALTLRSLTGMTTAQVARSFLVPEATMAQRLVRAKKRIRSTGIAFRVPPADQLHGRTAGVLAVLYVLFTEGYDAWAEPVEDVAGCAERRGLAADAVRLARLVARLLPDEPEARSLLALLLLQHARRDARTGPDGVPRTLEEQDRTLWRRDEIDEGLAVLDDALAARRPGPYAVQAAIAALHDDAPTVETTDWDEILALYDVLATMTPSPVVALNGAVARAMVSGPATGLAAVDEIVGAPELAKYHLLPAVRADLLRRAGRPDEAAAEYRRALAVVDREGDRRLLERRLAELQPR